MTKPMMDLRQLVEKSGDGAVTLTGNRVAMAVDGPAG